MSTATGTGAHGADSRPAARRVHWSAYATTALMAAIVAGAVALWVGGERVLRVDWVPAWGAELGFRVDGVAFLYTLIAGGIGLAVAAYSIAYLPRHLAEVSASRSREPYFYGFLSLFAVSMAGLAAADDLLLLFVFWDLTAVASYYLIAFDREREDARSGALAALVVTGVTAVLLLIGSVVLWSHYGTLSLERLFGLAEPDGLTTAAVALMLVAALAKSAQAPFHLWLPRAMVAPTPISAYLHAAAMVAAGVLLIGRIYPLVEASDLLLDLLVGLGLASILVGGAQALVADELKRILAFSTVSQYGYVVVIYGVGGPLAAGAAALYVAGHAIEKAALFLTTGAIGQATHTERLSELGGLGRRMPVLAAGSGLAAAGLAGLPLTLGFFQDELLFKAAEERGTALAIATGAAAALTLLYAGRFWGRIFLGELRVRVDPIPASLVAPVAVLGLAVAAGGLWVAPFEALAERAGAASTGVAEALEPAYHLDLRLGNVLALSAWAAAAAAALAAPRWFGALAATVRAATAVGPARAYDGALALANRISDAVHRVEVRTLRDRVAAVLVPAGALAAVGLLTFPFGGYEVGAVPRSEVKLAAIVGIVALATVALTFLRSHLPFVLLASAVGFGLAVVYAFFGAPDLVLITVLVETVLALVFFGVLALMPGDLLRRQARLGRRANRVRNPIVATIAGAFAFLVAWGGLSGPGGENPIGPRYVELAERAHAENAVTAIITDFRALDTLVEVSVVVVAVLGITGLVRGGRLW